MAHLDWRFYYGGDLCLVSRYPFTVPDVRDPDHVWRNGAYDPDRYQIKTPMGRLQLLNVHLETIRGGLEALAGHQWRGLPQFMRNREESARESRAARERTRHGPDRIVVAGDFNLPVESAIYRANWGHLLNAFSNCGRGFGHTKFTSLYGIRIDHVLTSDHWGCTDARVLASPYRRRPLAARRRSRPPELAQAVTLQAETQGHLPSGSVIESVSSVSVHL